MGGNFHLFLFKRDGDLKSQCCCEEESESPEVGKSGPKDSFGEASEVGGEISAS